VLLAERAGHVLGEGIAVTLAVGRAHERAHDLDVPLRDLTCLAPEVGETEIDVELEEIDATWAMSHGLRVGRGSDITAENPPRAAAGNLYVLRWVLSLCDQAPVGVVPGHSSEVVGTTAPSASVAP
jgi:hypothetical protein